MLQMLRRGSFPHTIALSASDERQPVIAQALSKALLCANGTGEDNCPACEAWSGANHPDLIVAGEPSKPPSIDECRRIISDAAFRPVVSDRRVVLVFSAEKMLPPAANSLLKLAEEPPEDVYVVLMLEDEKLLLPTLRSRSWMVSLPSTRAVEGLPPPRTEKEWADWVEQYAAAEIDDLAGLLAPWISYEIDRGAYERAALLERLRMVVQSKRLSRTMALDLVVMVLKEGFIFDHSFGDIW
ncbi:MAG: hypothetical protein GX181_02890 [Synergistaceae bacterium]|nr:hypothetical protein [Synergistaceae bacterium]